MADKTESSESSKVPILIGSAVIVAGLALGLWPDGNSAPSSAPSATASVTAAASVEASSAPVEPPYEPDLEGPQIGELLVHGAAEANGLAITGQRLVWLLTDSATLGSSRLDGGDPVVVFASDDKDQFGGSLAASNEHVWWTVENVGDEPESIHRLATSALDKPAGTILPVAKATSPDQLAFADGLLWANLGRILRGDGATPAVLAARDHRIVSLVAGSGVIAWLETPYKGDGADALMRLSGDKPEVWAGKLGRHDRDLLTLVGSSAYWAETRGSDGEEENILFAVDAKATRPKRITATGLVTAMASHGVTLIWAEAHGDEDKPTTLVRSLSTDQQRAPKQIGVVRGHVTALTLDDRFIYFSSPTGISRHPR